MHLLVQSRMELGNVRNDIFGFVVGDLAFPHDGREKQYEQHSHPHNGRLAKSILLVMHEYCPVDDEPDNARRHQNHEGFRGNGIHVPERWRKREEEEES